MDEKKARARKGTVGGGRAIGQKNLVAPAVKKSVAEIFRGMMGLDDEAVERTGQINRAGYGFRRRWQEILNGERSPDPAYTQVVRLSLAYGVGNPGKLQETTKPRESLIFLGLKPWEIRGELDVITDKIIAEKAAEDRIKALEAKKPETIEAATDSEVPESLELVQEPPENFTGGRR